MATFYAVGSGALYKISATSWAACHDDLTASSVFQGDIIAQAYKSVTGVTFIIRRGGISFEVTSVPVISASVLLYCSYLDIANGGNVVLVSGADLADTLVVADYGDLLDDVTSFGSISSASLVVNAWNEIALNAAGLVALSAALASGKFRVGVRRLKDIDNTEPNPSNETDEVDFYGYDAEDLKPKLVIDTGFIPRVYIM